MGSLAEALGLPTQHRRALLQHTAQGRGANVGCDGMGDMDGGREPDPDRSRGHGGHGRSGFAGRVAVIPSPASAPSHGLTFASSSDHLSTLTFHQPTHQTRLSEDDAAVQAPNSRPCLPAPWERMGGGGVDGPMHPAVLGVRGGSESSGHGWAGGRSGKKPGWLSMSTIHHDTTRHAQKIPSRITMHIADDDKMDARRGFPGGWDSAACASTAILHVHVGADSLGIG